MDDVVKIRSGVLPDDTRVVGFRGTEGISALYTFEIYLSLPSDHSAEFDLGDSVSARATLTLDRRDGRPPFQFHGLFSELSLVHELGGRGIVRAVLVPQLWHLTQTYHSRIFTNRALPDILKDILEDGGLSSDDFTLKLSQSYLPEEHVCQYQESHFDFISRWMEREGLYYYFEQGDDREKLIITDNKSFHDDMGTGSIRFYPITGTDTSSNEALRTFVCRHRALPATVRFKDYDHTKPKLDVSGRAAVSKAGIGEIHIHGARFFSPDQGKRLATLRAEEMLAREVVFTGSGTALYLRPGYTFKLEDYARGAAGTKYLPTAVEHYGNQAASTPEMKELTGLDSDEVYRVQVTAIPDKAQFRAERRTAWPRVYGTEHGTIDGEADSEYAQIDEHGRYVVRFAFDESDLDEGKASTRVRMMQPHGGGVEGWHFPLRKGTEVLFTFLGGDPDRPVIAGVVPNTLTPSPVTAGNHTRNVIQTGGRNRLEIEDKAGQQRITLSTPHANTYLRMGAPNDAHELIVYTDENAILYTGANWDVHVGGNLKEYVSGATSETYQGLHETYSQAVRLVDIMGTYKQSCHSNVLRTFYADHTSETTGSWTQHVSGGVVEKYDASVLQQFGPTTAIYASLDWTIPGAANINAPSWNLNGNSTTNTYAHIEESFGVHIEQTGFHYDASAMTMQLAVTTLQNTPFKFQNIVTGVKSSATAFYKQGVVAGTKGLWSEITGLFSVA